MRVAFIAPCISVGGADMFMSTLVQHTKTIEWAGVYLEWDVNDAQLKHFNKICPQLEVCEEVPEADVYICWSVPDVGKYGLDGVVIELCQNSDADTAQICRSNKDIVDRRVAVSKIAGTCFEGLPFEIIPNGIDANRCVPRYGRDYTRKALELDGPTLLFMGRLVPEKHPEILLEIIAKRPEFSAMFVGTGEMSGELYKQAERYTDARKVRFVQPEHYVGDYLAASDVFILMSEHEGIPLAVLEAWLAGVTTVTSALPGLLDVETVYGELTHTAEIDVDDVIDKLDNLDQTRAHRARGVVWNNFTIPRVALQWETFIYSAYMGEMNSRLKPLAVRPQHKEDK